MRRALLVSVFLFVLALVFVGGHLYLAQRLVLDLALPDGWQRAGLGVLAVLAGGLVLHPFAERGFPPQTEMPFGLLPLRDRRK